MIKTSVSQELHEDGWENGCCFKELIVKYEAPQNHWYGGKVEISILPLLREAKKYVYHPTTQWSLGARKEV